MKAWSIRMPDELLDWLREKAARETIKKRSNISINAIMVEILSAAKKADEKGGK